RRADQALPGDGHQQGRLHRPGRDPHRGRGAVQEDRSRQQRQDHAAGVAGLQHPAAAAAGDAGTALPTGGSAARTQDRTQAGVITRAQFIAYRMKTFDQLDADKDGTLSRLEFMKLAEPPFTPPSPDPATLVRRRAFYDKEFASIDANDDGKVTRAEFETSVALS